MITTEVTIVGGGISGLATAFYLKKLGIRSLLLEKGDRLGGLIRTDYLQGCELEAGPDSFISTKPAVAQLARDLRIENELIGSNDEKRQVFVVRNGQLIPMPKGMVLMVPTDWNSTLRSPLFSDKTKGRFLLETYRKPRQRCGDFSIREFVLDHFGEEALTYVTEPLLSGVYGGDAARLSARSVLPRFVEYEQQLGSLIRAAGRERSGSPSKGSFFQSFRGGMGTLAESLKESLDNNQIRLRSEVEKLQPGKDGWLVGTRSEQIKTAELVLACPAHAGSRLVGEFDPALAQELAAIPYSSAILVTLLYRRESFTHPLNGFGFLVPRPERQAIAAATWINTKFPSRIAPEFVAIRAFIVHPEADALLSIPEADLARLVQKDLMRLMGITSDPVEFRVYPWPQSMPQYVVGHTERLQKIRSLLQGSPGLHLVSNYLDGVGIPDCIRLAEQTTHQLRQSLYANSLF